MNDRVEDVRRAYRRALLEMAGYDAAEAAESVRELAGLGDAEFKAHAAVMAWLKRARRQPSSVGVVPRPESVTAAVADYIADVFGLENEG
jgi:hypothetical protein